MSNAKVSSSQEQGHSKPRRVRLNKKLAAYSAMATGAVAAAAGAPAQAVFTVHDIPDVTIDNSITGIWFNPVNGNVSTATASDNPGPSTFGAFGGGPLNNGIVANFAGQGVAVATTGATFSDNPFASRLNSGNSVLPTLSFSTSVNPAGDPLAAYLGFSFAGITPGPWEPAAQRGFVGLKFELNGLIHLGWAEITNNQDRSLTLHAVAWDPEPLNPPVVDGAVPEPATFGLGALALGAAGVAALKRRREAQAAA